MTLGAFSEIETAILEFKSQTKVSADEITFNTLIKAASRQKDLAKAQKYFEDMKSSGIKPNKITYNSIMDICVKNKRLSLALSYLQEMSSLGVSPDEFSYSIILNGIKHSKVSKDVYSNTISRLEDMVQKGTLKPDEIFYNCLIDLTTKYNDISKAESVYSTMKSNSIAPSVITYGLLIKAYGKSNQIEKAMKVYQEIKSSSQKLNIVTYGCLLDACVRANRMQLAEQLFQELLALDLKPNSIIYTTMIKGYSKTDQYARCKELFEKIKKEQDLDLNLVSYNCIIDACVRAHDIDSALRYFQDLKTAFSPDLITYSTLIKGYCSCKQIQEAI